MNERLQQRVLDGVLDLAILKKNNLSDDAIFDQIRYIQKLQFQQRIRDFENKVFNITTNFEFKNQMNKFFTRYSDLGTLLRFYTHNKDSQFEWTMWYHKWELFRNVVYIKISNDVWWLIRDMIQENIEKSYSSQSRKKGFLNRNLEKTFHWLSTRFVICVDLYNARVQVISHGFALDFENEKLFEIHPDFLRHLNLPYYRANCNFLQTKSPVKTSDFKHYTFFIGHQTSNT